MAAEVGAFSGNKMRMMYTTEKIRLILSTRSRQYHPGTGKNKRFDLK
jgi:hypothetical protein